MISLDFSLVLVALASRSDFYFQKVTRTLGDVPVAEVKEQLKAVKIFDLDGNKTIGFNKNNPKSLIGTLDLTAKAAVDFKVVLQAIKVESLYDDSIVNSK